MAAAPPLVTEYNPTAARELSKRHCEGVYAGELTDEQADAQAHYVRNAQEIEALERQMADAAARAGFSVEEMFAVQETSLHDAPARVVPRVALNYRGHEMPWATQYQLGASRRLVQLQQPRARPDYGALTQQALETVCSVLGVPRSLFSGGSSNVRAGAENAAADMHRTVRHWADTLSALMTLVYDATVGVRQLRTELRSTVQRVRERVPAARTLPAGLLLSSSDVREARTRTQVSLSFDLPPSIDAEGLTFMNSRGILDWKTYAQHALRAADMDTAQLASERDPWTADERKSLAGAATKQPAAAAAAAGKKTPVAKSHATESSSSSSSSTASGTSKESNASKEGGESKGGDTSSDTSKEGGESKEGGDTSKDKSEKSDTSTKKSDTTPEESGTTPKERKKRKRAK